MSTTVPQPETIKLRKPRAIYYPTEDGKPLAEGDQHLNLMYDFVIALKAHFADLPGQPDVYVSGNNFVFYQEGDPEKRIVPDCYIVFGVPQQQRDSFMSWREGNHLPNVIFEFTSRKRKKEDMNIKRPLYETTLRVAEYFLFDPRGDYLQPRLQGFRRVEGRYESIPLVEGRMRSEQLTLDLIQQDDMLNLFDPLHDVFLPMPFQALERTRQATQAIAKAKKQLKELETQSANEEAQRAESESQSRAELEAENERLRARLTALLGANQT